jgi:hypothetical protein
LRLSRNKIRTSNKRLNLQAHGLNAQRSDEALTIQNLDVRGTSQDQGIETAQGSAGRQPPTALLSVVGEGGSERRQRGEAPTLRRYRPHGTECLSLTQATNIIEAVDTRGRLAAPW